MFTASKDQLLALTIIIGPCFVKTKLIYFRDPCKSQCALYYIWWKLSDEERKEQDTNIWGPDRQRKSASPPQSGPVCDTELVTLMPTKIVLAFYWN